MSLAYYWHTLSTGELHKGPSSECRKCNKKSSIPAPQPKDNGRRGGIAASSKRPSRLLRCCTECGAPINRKSKTGLCLKCFNKQRTLRKQPTRNRKHRHCVNPACSNRIDDDNKSGLCLHCYRDSKVWQQYKKHQDSWMKSLLLPSDT